MNIFYKGLDLCFDEQPAERKDSFTGAGGWGGEGGMEWGWGVGAHRAKGKSFSSGRNEILNIQITVE